MTWLHRFTLDTPQPVAKHPGHGDQAVHSPRKGGGAGGTAAGGAGATTKPSPVGDKAAGERKAKAIEDEALGGSLSQARMAGAAATMAMQPNQRSSAKLMRKLSDAAQGKKYGSPEMDRYEGGGDVYAARFGRAYRIGDELG